MPDVYDVSGFKISGRKALPDLLGWNTKRACDPLIEAVDEVQKNQKEYEAKMEAIKKKQKLEEFKKLLRDKFRIEYVEP